MNNPQLAAILSLKTQHEYTHVALVQHLTAKDGENTGITGTFIYPSVNSLEKQGASRGQSTCIPFIIR